MGDAEKTTKYLVLAAGKARAGSAYEEALGHLDRALLLWEGEASLRVADLLLLRATTLRSLSKPDEAVQSYRKAIDLFEATGALAKVAEASIALSYLQAWRLDSEAANRTMERAHKQMAGQDPRLLCSVLSMRAAIMSAGGDPASADAVFGEARTLLETMKAPAQGPAALLETIHYYQSFQMEKVAAAAPRLASAFRAAGDSWNASAVEFYGLWAILYCGRPGEVEAAHPGAIAQAEKIGHHGAIWALKMGASILSAARGELEKAQDETADAWEFGGSHEVGWNFATGLQRGHFALWRGDLAEAERWYAHGLKVEGKSYLSGLSEACLFAALAEQGDPRAAKAWSNRHWKFPVPGQSNPLGVWTALERSVVGLARMGLKKEAAALRPLTEELILTGAWTYSVISGFRTAAGIAAACEEDWPGAEHHHRIAIDQTDRAPYRHLQPVAREWYAEMLLDRHDAGDVGHARALLVDAVAMDEAMGMPARARHARARLASL